MISTATGFRSAAGGGARWLLAFGVSFGTHVTLLVLLAMLGGAATAPQYPITVALLGEAPGGGGAAQASGAAGADGRGSGTPDASDEVVPEQAAPPAPMRHAAATKRALATRARPASAANLRRAPATADGPAAGTSWEDAGNGSGSSEGDGSGNGEASGGGDGRGDLRASCASCPVPEYPARARRQGWQGTVDVQLRVGRDGLVEEASVGRSSGFAALDAAAVTVARRSRFRVAATTPINGQLRYRFVLEGADRPL